MVGIYKITNPNNKVYIGQSVDVYKRFNFHQNPKEYIKTAIGYSIKKYGKENHTYELIHELPEDVSQEVLNNYECLYMQLYKDAGFVMLNIKEGGSNGKMSQESKIKVSIGLTGKKQSKETVEKRENTKRNLSEEKKKEISLKCSIASKKYHQTPEAILKNKLIGERSKGKIVSESTREKMRLNNIGKVYSEEQKEKRRIAMKKMWADPMRRASMLEARKKSLK